MTQLRGLVLLTLLLPGIARRSLRTDDFHYDAQQQNNTHAKAFEVSAEAREALIPEVFGKPIHAARGAGAWRPLGQARPRAVTTGRGAILASAAGRSEAAADPQPKFKPLIPIQFILAIGDPKATSGTGAEKWGIWRQDPGPRGVLLRDYEEQLAATDGKAPAGWTVDPSRFFVEEYGRIMEAPDPLPLQKLERDGKTEKVVAPKMRYLVTGDRAVTAVLTVHADGRWELSEGTLYDVTHLPCRTAVYTPTPGGVCKPLPSMQSSFPVEPGGCMPKFDGCNTEDRAVLFVTGVEVSEEDWLWKLLR